MENYIKELRSNSKVGQVKSQLNPSLNDELSYKNITVVLNTTRNLFEWAKAIYLIPQGDEFEIEMTLCANPEKTILKDAYLKHKTTDWTGKSKSHSTNPVVNLKGDSELVKTLINYLYSTIN
jgi:ribosomal protein L35